MLRETILLSGESYPYGYGWRLSEHPHWGRMAEHSGGWPGYSTKFYRCTEHDLMMTYLLNQTGCDGLARAEMEAGLKAIMLGGEAQSVSYTHLFVVVEPQSIPSVSITASRQRRPCGY